MRPRRRLRQLLDRGRRGRGRRPDHVLLHLPGKTGSSSLRASLRATAPELRTHHVHFYSDTSRHFMGELLRRPDLPDPIRASLGPHLKTAERVRALAERTAPERLCVVTGLREPSERTISAFFQNLDRFAPDLAADPRPERSEEARSRLLDVFRRAQLSDDEPSAEALYAHFVLIFASVDWFDVEYWEPYGLDLRNLPLRGRNLLDFRHRGIRFLLYRFEAFAKVRPEIVRRITGREPVLTEDNRSPAKSYGALLSALQTGPRPRELDALFGASEFHRQVYGRGESPRGIRRPLALGAHARASVSHGPPSSSGSDRA